MPNEEDRFSFKTHAGAVRTARQAWSNLDENFMTKDMLKYRSVWSEIVAANGTSLVTSKQKGRRRVPAEFLKKLERLPNNIKLEVEKLFTQDDEGRVTGEGDEAEVLDGEVDKMTAAFAGDREKLLELRGLLGQEEAGETERVIRERLERRDGEGGEAEEREKEGDGELPGRAAVAGDRVEVWWEEDEMWFSGTVEETEADKFGNLTVQYDDGDRFLAPLFVRAPSTRWDPWRFEEKLSTAELEKLHGLTESGDLPVLNACIVIFWIGEGKSFPARVTSVRATGWCTVRYFEDAIEETLDFNKELWNYDRVAQAQQDQGGEKEKP